MNGFKPSAPRSEHRPQLTQLGEATKPPRVELAPCRHSITSMLGISRSLDKLLAPLRDISQHRKHHPSFTAGERIPVPEEQLCSRARSQILIQAMGTHLARPGAPPPPRDATSRRTA